MKKKQLRKDEIKVLSSKITEFLKIEINLGKKDRVELIDDKVISINSCPSFFYDEKGDMPLPLLKFLLSRGYITTKKVIVDMGAVRFVASGADVMRPGITHIDEGIQKEDITVVVDESHKKPIAVGRAIYSSEEMSSMVTGKVIQILHYVGDTIWKRY